MVSSSEYKIIHVRLLDEPVPVWRPVLAKEIRKNEYQIVEQKIPDYEEWEFKPGQIVQVENASSDGESYLRVISTPENLSA